MRAACALFGNLNPSILPSMIGPASTYNIRIWPSLEEPEPNKFTTDSPFAGLFDVVSSHSTQLLVTSDGKEFQGNLFHQLLCTEGRPVQKSRIPLSFLQNQMSSKFCIRESDACLACGGLLSKDATGFAAKLLEKFESFILEQQPGDFRQRLSALRYGTSFQKFGAVVLHLIYLVRNNLGNERLQERVTRLFLMPATRPFVRALVLCDTAVSQALLHQALILCCHVLDLDLLQVLVLYGIDVNKTIKGEWDDEPLTPLLYCMSEDAFGARDQKDQYEFIKALLAAGADANLCSCKIKVCRDAEIRGETSPSFSSAKHQCHHDCCETSPLARAVIGDAGPQVISILIDHGAVVCECHSLGEAIDQGAPLDDVRAMLTAMPALATFSQHSGFCSSALEAALAVAADCEKSEMPRLLLDNGASATQFLSSSSRQSTSDSQNCIPSSNACLILALRGEDDDIPCILLARGADTNSCCWAIDGGDWNYPFIIEKGSVGLQNYAHTDFQEWLYKSKGVGTYLPIQAAIASGSIHRVRIMLSARASLLCCHGTPPLVLAVQTGNAELVRLLITLGADLNATSTTIPMPGTRISPLAEAAARKDMQIFNMLLTAGANINFCDSTDGLTPLQAAILSQAREFIDTLLQHQETDVWKPSASITRIDALVAFILANDILLFDFLTQIASQQTIIPAFDLQNMAAAAIQADDPYFLDRVIDMGANLYYPDVAYRASTSILRLQRLLDRGLQLDNFVGYRTFFDAVFRGALDRGSLVVVKYLIGLTTSIEAASIKELCRSLKEWTSFCFSQNMKERRAQSREILELLYQRLSNDHVRIISGGLGTITAILDLRYQRSYLSCPVDALLWKLLEAGFRDFDCHCVCDRHALYWACYTEKSELVQRLLESGISPTCPRFCSMHNRTWSPALEVSAKKGDAASVSVLIAHGAEVNPTCEAFCNTPLESACRSGELEVVKMLLRHGAKHTFNDGSRESTALMIAAAHDNPDVVSELIAYGAEVNAAPSSKSWSSTALTEACEHGQVDVVKVLIINKADINAPAPSEDGFTALQAAAINGHGKICQILVEQGADIAATTSSGDGFTAIDGAAKFGRMDILKYLLDNYSGDEPIEAVCKRARNVALAHWQDHVANMIFNYRKPI